MCNITKLGRFIIRAPLISLALLSALGGCTGGGSDGNITLVTNNQGADPVLLEIPVAYIRRALPEEASDLRDPLAFNRDAQLIVRERSAASADDIDVTRQIAAIVAAEEGVSEDQLAIDIKGLESSYDGNTLVFAARVVPLPVANNLDDTTWNLWTYSFETLQAQYLIPSRIKRNEGMATGGGQDIAPHFLPDDRIVFSSTRQVASQARLLNEGRNQIFAAVDEDGRGPAAVLHIYDPLLRGEEFTQISFNRSHDLDPTVLASGEIVFSRWNNTNTDHISLYRITPAGLGLSPLYGFHSQSSGTEGARIEFTQPRELDDGRLVSVTLPFASTTYGGDISIIDAQGFVEVGQPIWANAGTAGMGHTPLTDTAVRTDGLLSSGGQFASVYPLRDGTQRLLVSWSDCRVFDADADNPTNANFKPCKLQPDNTNTAPPLYGAWIYNPVQNTQLPVVLPEEGFLISEIIALEPRDFPDLIPLPDTFDNNLASENKGRLLIDSVYDLNGMDASPSGIAQHAQPGTAAYASRPARFLRIIQPVPIPQREVFDIPNYAAGVGRGSGFREIAGYTPVEPDGSVTVTVPANRPFTFSVLDANGRRIGARHDYWLQLAPGEVVHCSGCHSSNDPLPHGRLDSQPATSNPGARALATGFIGFPSTDINLFADAPGATMAAVWNRHRPLGNAATADRELSLEQRYSDQWSDESITPDAAITDRAYDPAWTDIPADKPIIVNNLDPGLPGRIVINYIDHIQPIWERVRTPVLDAGGTAVDTCMGCHNSADNAMVAAGQLDLTSAPSDIEPNHYRSYRELLSGDNLQWLDNGGVVAERQRICTETDSDGNVLTTVMTLAINPSMRAASANGSRFFGCFSGATCGLDEPPPLPENCTEDGGVVEPATRNTVDHAGLLSAAELRLLSEWLDIGGQYYNNPFDSRLAD